MTSSQPILPWTMFIGGSWIVGKLREGSGVRIGCRKDYYVPSGTADCVQIGREFTASPGVNQRCFEAPRQSRQPWTAGLA
jgi:hypothetical protein